MIGFFLKRGCRLMAKHLRRCYALMLIVFFAQPLFARAEESGMHRGPSLRIEVQRGAQRLPSFRVPKLEPGDSVWVDVDLQSIGDQQWVLVAGTLTPTGHHLTWHSLDLSAANNRLEIPIQSIDQTPFVIIAPQLRNLFGLNTSIRTSVELILESVRSDPQRFIDLQRVDLVNAAITALERGFDTVVRQLNPTQARDAVVSLAAKFGVKSVNPACFRQEAIDTACVALHIVGSKDFLLPAAGDLAQSVGAKQAADLAGLLSSNLRFFVQAGDVLSQRFQDQYEFAASFGRVLESSEQTTLFSRSRFRRGSIKTAYVYVPAWFPHNEPSLKLANKKHLCLHDGYLPIQFEGRLPLMNYWHAWWIKPTDVQSGFASPTSFRYANLLIHQERLVFDADALMRDAMAREAMHGSTHTRIEVQAGGRYGFESIQLEPVDLWFPSKAAMGLLLRGQHHLNASELNHMVVTDHPLSHCLDEVRLLSAGQTIFSNKQSGPQTLAIDLSGVDAGEVQIELRFRGGPIESGVLRVRPPRPKLTQITHHAQERFVMLEGLGLERIDKLAWLGSTCRPKPNDWQSLSEASSLRHQVVRFDCDNDIADKTSRQGDAELLIKGHDQPLKFPVKVRPARPNLALAQDARSIVIRPGPQSKAWGLHQQGKLVTVDSRLSLLFKANASYKLQKGAYSLAMRLVADAGASPAIELGPLLIDHRSQELRTRQAVSLEKVELPGVLSRIEYQVRHEESQLASDWQSLGIDVLMVPELDTVTCSVEPGVLWLSGNLLELIDQAEIKLDHSEPTIDPDMTKALNTATLEACPHGLCLALQDPLNQGAQQMSQHVQQSGHMLDLFIRLRWIDKTFKMKFARPRKC